MADFTGFYFNHIHSSTYNIYRVSNGSRFEEGLIPDFEDFSVSVVGGNGDLYQGRRFKPITFKIPIAFDSMTEQNLRDLRNWLASEEPKPFQFDERPYKTYFVKLSSRPVLNYICLMEDIEKEGDLYSGGPTEFTPAYDGFKPLSPIEPVSGPTTYSPISIPTKQRIYKGEGELTFTAYDPFGYCIDESVEMTIKRGLTFSKGINWQDLGEYIPSNDWNGAINEWGRASRLLTLEQIKAEKINKIYLGDDSTETTNIYYIPLYNPGDLNTDIQIYFDFDKWREKFSSSNIISIQLQQPQLRYYWTSNAPIPEDYYEWIDKDFPLSFETKGLYGYNHILLNTKNHSLQVYPSLNKNKKLDMRYDLIQQSNWIQIPIGKSRLKISVPKSIVGQNFKIEIKYNYKYY